MQCLEMENFLPSETKTDLDVMKNCVTFCRLKFNHDPYWQGDWERKCQLVKSVWFNLYASQRLVIFIHIGRDYSSTIIAHNGKKLRI